MRKLFIFFTLLLSISLSTQAGIRSEEEALAIAQKQFTLCAHLSSPSLTLMPQATAQRLALKGKNTKSQKALATPYYIYNNADGGFIIISGSDQMQPVMAYSDKGSISADPTLLPDGLRYWLGFAAEAAAYIDQHPKAGIKAKAGSYAKNYEPLLGNISFNQNSPYNDDCPNGTYTGCMATAMAQVMTYHKAPDHGYGTVSTTYNGRTYSADLTQETYDWSKILPTYKGGKGTPEQRAEVAKLLYHVGLSLHMEYGENSSGSVSTMYPTALRDKFGYNKNVVLLNRDGYTYGQWVNLLLGELEAKRPIIYDGVCNDGGHAFVLDGYRASDGFFHVNWGWEGMSDGYYDVCLLNPQETGIGATLSSGFTTYQDAMINVTPDEKADTKYHLPLQPFGGQGNITSTTGTVQLGQQADLAFEYISNMNDKSFYGEYGALIVNEKGEEVTRVKAGTVSAQASTMLSNKHAEYSGGRWTIPSNLKEGDYRVYIYMQESGRDDYAILHTAINTPNYVNMNVKAGTATFVLDLHTPTGLTASDWSFQKGEIAHGTQGISCTVTNSGDEVEHGGLIIQIDVPNQLTQRFAVDDLHLLPGESKQVSFPVLCNEYGEYRIRSFELARYNATGYASIVEAGSLTFTINRSAAEIVKQLNNRLAEVQSILNNSRASGNYPDEACNTLQGVIDEIKDTSTTGLSAAEVQALIERLNAALNTFYKSMSADKEAQYWSYVGDKTIDTSWCPGGTGTVYFGISIPESELTPYIGGQITGLQCLFGQNRWYTFTGDDLVLRLMLFQYDGSGPGERILATTDVFSPENYGVYDDYIFNEPYTINGEGLFCVVEMAAKYGGYFGAMGASKQCTMPGACWMNNGNGWEDLYYTYGNEASGLAIKTIILGGSSVVDAKLTNIKALPVAVGEDITISGKIQNISTGDLEEYELSWSHDDDGLAGTKSFTQHLASGSSTDFSITIPGFATAKRHNVHLAVSKVNGQPDAIADNSTYDIPVVVTSHKFIRNVVLEENTGTWCGFCPRGIVAIEYMKEKYGSQFIPISIHTQTDIMADDYLQNAYAPLLLGLNSAPSGLIDRKDALYTQMDKSSVEQFFKKELESCNANITCKATYDEKTRKISVDTETEFSYDFSGADYRITYVVLEDKLGPYLQNNSYAGGGYGTCDGWEKMSSTVRITYDDVARALVPSYTGQRGSIPANVKADEIYKYTYTFSMPSNVSNPDNVRIAALIIDPATGEIVNACQAPLVKGDLTGIEGLSTINSQPSTLYDLTGRRINGATRGITLQQGRKVIR